MSCLDTIVTLGVCPDEATSLSGFRLIQAGGMNVKAFANIATDSSGIDMVMEKKELAILQVTNDLLGQFAANNVITTVVNPEYPTALFDPTVNKGSNSTGRGTRIHKNLSWKGSMRDTLITGVEVFPFTSGSGSIRIEDGNKITEWDIDFIGNQENYYDHTQLSGFPYVMINKEVKVLFVADVSVSSAKVQCKTGCHGAPNPCGYADGWDGSKAVKGEGYGVNVYFKCECNYSKIICSNPRLFGELYWIKWQQLIYDEQYKSNRFHNYVTYNKETIDEVIMPQLQRDYSEKWNNITSNMKSILSTFRDDCLKCEGIRWVVNV